MSLKDFYPAIEAAYHTLSVVYAPAIQSGCATAGLSAGDFFLLTALPSFLPDPISVKLLQVRGAYTAPEFYEAELRSLEKKGMLENVGSQQYQLAQLGKDTINGIMQSIHAALAGIQPLPVMEMMDLASRLKEYADACLSAPEPPGVWSIQHSRRVDPGRGAPAMVRIEQFLTELCAFRDDAHLAAWRSYESNGHAWDILTLLWIEKEMYTEEISNKLKRRGNSMEQTRLALENLVKKGWVTQDQEVVQITPFGEDIRKIAEETTNRFYYTPLKNFSESDIDQTIELIEKFRRALPKS